MSRLYIDRRCYVITLINRQPPGCRFALSCGSPIGRFLPYTSALVTRPVSPGNGMLLLEPGQNRLILYKRKHKDRSRPTLPFPGFSGRQLSLLALAPRAESRVLVPRTGREEFGAKNSGPVLGHNCQGQPRSYRVLRSGCVDRRIQTSALGAGGR